MRLIIPKPGRFFRFWLSTGGKVMLAVFLIAGITGLAVLSHFWFQYSRLIDRKLAAGGPFNTPSKIFAAPEAVYVGQPIPPAEIVSHLRSAGDRKSVV